MRRTPWRAVSVVVILGLALLSCDGPNRGTNTQPSSASGFQIVVTATPNVLRPPDTTIIQAKVFDVQGRLVDGALVTVTATGAVKPDNVASGPTVRGIFTTSFFVAAGTLPFTSIVTATVEDAVATTLVTVK